MLRALRDGQIARFAKACGGCPLAHACTSSPNGRTIRVGPHEALLTSARERQADPACLGQRHRLTAPASTAPAAPARANDTT